MKPEKKILQSGLWLGLASATHAFPMIYWNRRRIYWIWIYLAVSLYAFWNCGPAGCSSGFSTRPQSEQAGCSMTSLLHHRTWDVRSVPVPTEPPFAAVQLKTISQHLWFSLTPLFSSPPPLLPVFFFFKEQEIHATKSLKVLCHIFFHLLSGNLPPCM